MFKCVKSEIEWKICIRELDKMGTNYENLEKITTNWKTFLKNGKKLKKLENWINA